MSLSLQMRFDDAKNFFQNAQVPADKKITLSFEDDSFELIQQLRKQKALQAIRLFQGSGKGGNVDELLQERQHEREKDW